MTNELQTDFQALSDKYQVQFTGKVITLSPQIEEIDIKPVLPTVSADPTV